jgi:Xaa-Pro aminopeptidase
MNKWTDEQIIQHKTAATLLCEILDEAFEFIRQNSSVTEYEVQQFILDKYNDNEMTTENDPPIVAFRESTANVHYFPEKSTALTLKPDSLIMIDIWAKMDYPNAPFADITWMAWHGGKVPVEIQRGFDIVLESRDIGVEFIKKKLAKSEKIQSDKLGKSMEDITMASDIQDFVPHAYGHSLGTTSCHGKLGIIYSKSEASIINQVGYTIEPGMYIDGKYGFRSEFDFLIAKNGELEITTGVQRKLEIV